MSFGKSSKDDKEIPLSVTAGNSTVQNSGGQGLGGQGRPEAFLGKGCKIVGTLTFSGPVEIEGCVEGEIIAQDRLTIGESAVVKGKISGSEVVIKGEVHGDIAATKRLSLRRPARILGNLSCALLSIDEGVSFEGKCQMSNVSSGTMGTGTMGTVTKGELRGSVVSLAEKVA